MFSLVAYAKPKGHVVKQSQQERGKEKKGKEERKNKATSSSVFKQKLLLSSLRKKYFVSTFPSSGLVDKLNKSKGKQRIYRK